MRKLLLLSLLIFVPAVMGATSKRSTAYLNRKLSVKDRVADLLAQMTLAEKITMLGGTGFSTQPIARLNVPPMNMSDGALGVRWSESTSFPAAVLMASSFDRNLYQQVSEAIGQELRAEGRDMLLGPTVGIARVPFGGRNYESLGEDPFLTSEMVASYIHGLHNQNAVATVKHYALNDQEYDRMTINSVADERTMHEIHLVAFERAVHEGVDSVMASYNLVNGTYSSENPTLLTDILRTQWGFTGLIVSDWGATHSTIPAAQAGLDLEMPTAQYFGAPLTAAVQANQIPVSMIDDKVSHILTVMFQRGLFDNPSRPDPSVVNSPAHQKLALQMATEGHVLLKNQNGILPIDLAKMKKIAVIGPNAVQARTGGGGSSFVQPVYAVSAYQGMVDRVGSRGTVNAAFGMQMPDGPVSVDGIQMIPAQGTGPGLYGEYFSNTTLTGTPVFSRVDYIINNYNDGTTSPDPRLAPQNYSIRWTGKLISPVTGNILLSTTSDDGVRVWIDGKLVIDDWTQHGATTDNHTMAMNEGEAHDVRIEYFQAGGGGQMDFDWTLPADALMTQALALAKASDVVILGVGFDSDLESEGLDRATFGLPPGQDAFIQAVVAQNPNTILVVNTGNPIDMSAWIDKVPAIIYAWYPGQEGGHALADIVLGNTNPSGRLPVTMLKQWKDSPAYGSYPEQNGQAIYQEGIYVGYRYFDKQGITPNFPFGHGLSYTKFSYSNLTIVVNSALASAPSVTVTATITNTGAVAGAEVAQLYVQDLAPKIDRPMQELKGFQRVFLQPGESQQVTFSLNQFSFAYYDVLSHGWLAQPGQFMIRVGASSRDIRVVGDVELQPAPSSM